MRTHGWTLHDENLLFTARRLTEWWKRSICRRKPKCCQYYETFFKAVLQLRFDSIRLHSTHYITILRHGLPILCRNWTTRRQTNSPTNQIAEIDILTFRLWEQLGANIPCLAARTCLEIRNPCLKIQKWNFWQFFYHCCDNRASLNNAKSMLILTISLFRHSFLRG